MLAEKAQGGASRFCCEPGLTEREIGDILSILPAAISREMPFFAMGGSCATQEDKLVLASKSFLYLFGVQSLDRLSHVVSSGTKKSWWPLAGLAETLILDAAPRSMRLRFRIGSAVKTITLLCRRVRAGEAPPLFAGAVLDVADHGKRTGPSKTRKRTARRAGQQKGTFEQSEQGGGSGRTLLKREQHRQKSEFRELSAILETTADGVAVLDQEGRILSLNRSGEALFGFDQNEVAGAHFTALIAPASKPLALDYFERLKTDNSISLLNHGREVEGLTRQGGTIPVFITLGRIGDASGSGALTDLRFCAILRDLTHWKNVERELLAARREAERASALKSDFLAKVSHEIRTPLSAILGFAEVMLDGRFGPVANQRYESYLKDICASGALVMSLVNDLLDLSKIEAGKMEFAFASIDANRIVSECVSIMRPQAGQEGVVIRLSLSPALPNILADERSLRQIVLNLLSNAVKFNKPGGRVSVATAFADTGSAIIRIRDTGTGMSGGDIGAAFEPFRRLATTKPSKGTGLGLPLTKALVEANHASLTLKSKQSQGTLAEIVFPPYRVVAS
ncbi:PAS domain-containing sensor histidine kinase [Methylocapsa sp. D3K7]|uniref:PAS domain-containing sensor histidine kinase n=1 Tax=Methylocapsa sp. D3K7 TaxID=3041435 RepID=UPI00244E68D5|nr:PAS domain-containing sensor histidine kinase [Methylocapsa sp. D3K7]WGJ15618.1 PAS domain-containing sensor histidine kinase [Methylocapsa sp. D3K7]